MSRSLEWLRARGVLSDLDWHFARAVGRIGGDQRPAVLLAAALASRAVGRGHVCLDLPRLIDGAPLIDEAGDIVDCAWPPLDDWTAALRGSPLIRPGTVGMQTPLVLDQADRLYLRRYWAHQCGVAAAIQTRVTAAQPAVDEARLIEGLDRLFPPTAAAFDDQRLAAIVAVLRRFCVISGGPGTGKTYTVVRILALLAEQALGAGHSAPRVLLLAPTGKAAARLSESVGLGLEALPCAADVRAAIPTEALTVHRGLGAAAGGRGQRFRHHAENPLVADVVLVDEASMVDLALLARLVAATPPAARLILLGDQDQLASVEAGAVLGDICNSGSPRAYSRPFIERLGPRFATQLPLASAAPDREGIWDSIVSLRRSYRYRPDSGIGRVASAINAGDLDAVLEALAAGAGVARIDPAADGTLGAELERAVLDGFLPAVTLRDPVARLQAFNRFRVLCAHRRGPFGVEAANAHIEGLLAAAGYLRTDNAFYVGRPILITRNDYQLELFNGDVGTIAEDADEPGRTVAVFLGPGGVPRRLAPSRLPPHETVFAMSVHKSQGSEFDAVAVLLPEQPSPIVSRELLYTAITRARERVMLSANQAVIESAVAHRLERASGLRDALWGVPPHATADR